MGWCFFLRLLCSWRRLVLWLRRLGAGRLVALALGEEQACVLLRKVHVVNAPQSELKLLDRAM